MQIIGDILVVVMTALCSYSVWLLQHNKKNKDNSQEALKLLMKKELRDVHDRCTAQNYITVGELEYISEVYQIYHNLGGNGTGTLLYESLKELEIR